MLDAKTLVDTEMNNVLNTILVGMDNLATRAVLALDKGDIEDYEICKQHLYSLELRHDAILLSSSPSSHNQGEERCPETIAISFNSQAQPQS